MPDLTHFGLATAIEELRSGVDTLYFDAPETILADDALRVAIVIYAMLVHASSKTVQHGLDEQVRALIDEVLAE